MSEEEDRSGKREREREREREKEREREREIVKTLDSIPNVFPGSNRHSDINKDLHL